MIRKTDSDCGEWTVLLIQYREKTYYAKLKADTSKNYNLKVQYTADNGVYVPASCDSTTTKKCARSYTAITFGT